MNRETSAAQRHLDLGCGTRPRNPYQRPHLCGVDIRPWSADAAAGNPSVDYRTANLVLGPIPWTDNSFASVSAYDFLEHVPRLMVLPDGSGTRFPFIELMDEVWRVLTPGGRLYAVTPAFPSPAAFQDPTHVNFITDETHTYFCGPDALGRMYGFHGQFRALRVQRVHPGPYTTDLAQPPPAPPDAWQRRLARALRDTLRRLRGRTSVPGWLLWELEAVKPHPHV